MLKERIKEVAERYVELPKSTNDEGEFVIIAERDESECYETCKECLGVKIDGTLIWCYLSGCSCRGGNENKEITDVTVKVFEIAEDETVETFYNNHKIESSEENYESY